MRRTITLILIAVLLAIVVVFVWSRSAASARLAALSARAEAVETRHGAMDYTQQGDGPTVLVIHGAGGGFDQGELIAAHFLAPCFRLLSVSRFGYLGSPVPTDASPMAQADALADLLAALAVGPVGVLAMSGGVPSALELAIRHPDAVSGLVLLSSAPFGPMPDPAADRAVPPWIFRAFFASDVPYGLLVRLRPGLLRLAFDARADLMAGASAEDRALVAALIAAFPPVRHRRAGLANEGAALDPEVGWNLGAVGAPVLIVHAEGDAITPVAVAAHLARHLRRARFVRLPSGGHLLLGHRARVRAAGTHILRGTTGNPSDTLTETDPCSA
ncbi:MAG: alpha/beta hydrolase [Pseudomonadota bacterium]